MQGKNTLNLGKICTSAFRVFDKGSLAFAIERLHSTRHAFLTWEMNIKEISKSHSEGETVLFCCSVLNSKDIPQLVITDFLLTAHGTSATWRFRAGVSAVQKYSLLRETSTDKVKILVFLLNSHEHMFFPKGGGDFYTSVKVHAF